MTVVYDALVEQHQSSMTTATDEEIYAPSANWDDISAVTHEGDGILNISALDNEYIIIDSIGMVHAIRPHAVSTTPISSKRRCASKALIESSNTSLRKLYVWETCT
jgi:hypothetical protein